MTSKDNHHWPYDLENMSVPELEVLLQQDFIASNDDAPDVDYIMEITEVIQKKKQAMPDYQPMDAEKAWEEFQSLYIAEDGQTNSIYHSELEEVKENTPKLVKHESKGEKNNAIRKRLIIAALIAALLAVTMIPVSGYANVLQMAIAYWTDDYFSFAPAHRTPGIRTQETAQTVPAGFEDLRDFAIEHSITDLMIPQYIPDGFQVADTILNEFLLTGGFNFNVVFTKDDDYISVDIIREENEPRTTYEMDRDDPITYHLEKIEYYVFSNAGESISTFSCNNIEYSFGTTLSEKELKQIINSMYER